MAKPAWQPTPGQPYGPVRPKKPGRARGCFGIGCAVVVVLLVIAVVLAVIGGSRTTVRTGGEGALVAAVTVTATAGA
jgi:hypothetical protein